MTDAQDPVGSLDELITRRLAEFFASHIDTQIKVTVLEAAWQDSAHAHTVREFARLTGRTSARIQADLEQLVTDGLFLQSGEPGSLEPAYQLTGDRARYDALGRMLEWWADPSFRTRAVAQLRYSRH